METHFFLWLDRSNVSKKWLDWTGQMSVVGQREMSVFAVDAIQFTIDVSLKGIVVPIGDVFPSVIY